MALLFSVESIALGQAGDRDAAIVARAIEDAANRAIARHVEPRDFRVFAAVTLATSAGEPQGYLPGTSGAGPLDVEAARARVAAVSLDVLVRSDLVEGSRALITEVLKRDLRLDLGGADRLSIAPMRLAAPATSEKPNELNTVIRSLAEALRGLAPQPQKQAEPPADTRTAEELAKQRETMGQLLGEQRKEIERLAQAVGPATSTSAGDYGRFAAIGLLALLGLAAAYLVSRSIQSVGTGIAKAGAELAATFGNGDRRAERGTDSEAQKEAGARGTPTEAAHPTSLREEIDYLRQTIIPAVTERLEAIVIPHVRALADAKDGLDLCAATLEFLGESLAPKVFASLPPDQSRKLLRYLRAGRYQRPRDVLLVEAGERLGSAVFQDSCAGRRDLDVKVAGGLAGLSTKEHLTMLQALSPDAGARYCRYLSPQILARVLESASAEGENPLKIVLSRTALATRSAQSAEKDPDILAALRKHLTSRGDDSEEAIVDLYEEVVAQIPDEVVEQVVGVMTAVGGAARRYAEERHVSAATLLRFKEPYLARLADELSVKDLAAVCTSFTPEQSARVEAVVVGRRRELLSDELERLAALDPGARKFAFRRASTTVVAKIRALLLDVPPHDAFGEGEATGSPQSLHSAA